MGLLWVGSRTIINRESHLGNQLLKVHFPLLAVLVVDGDGFFIEVIGAIENALSANAFIDVFLIHFLSTSTPATVECPLAGPIDVFL
jgi:hypothetical protein